MPAQASYFISALKKSTERNYVQCTSAKWHPESRSWQGLHL